MALSNTKCREFIILALFKMRYIWCHSSIMETTKTTNTHYRLLNVTQVYLIENSLVDLIGTLYGLKSIKYEEGMPGQRYHCGTPPCIR